MLTHNAGAVTVRVRARFSVSVSVRVRVRVRVSISVSTTELRVVVTPRSLGLWLQVRFSRVVTELSMVRVWVRV